MLLQTVTRRVNQRAPCEGEAFYGGDQGVDVSRRRHKLEVTSFGIQRGHSFEQSVITIRQAHDAVTKASLLCVSLRLTNHYTYSNGKPSFCVLLVS